MSQPYAASKPVNLSKEDRAQLEKLNSEIDSSLQQLHSLGMRALGLKGGKNQEITRVEITANANEPSPSPGTANANIIRKIDIKLTDGDGNCVRLEDPPGTCSPC